MSEVLQEAADQSPRERAAFPYIDPRRTDEGGQEMAPRALTDERELAVEAVGEERREEGAEERADGERYEREPPPRRRRREQEVLVEPDAMRVDDSQREAEDVRQRSRNPERA